MSAEEIPYIKWGEYHSKNPDKPDVLQLQIVDTSTFESDLTTNVHVKQKVNDSWEDRILPLKSHESENSSLLKSWDELKKKFVADMEFHIKTYLGLSKNNRPIRRFVLVI